MARKLALIVLVLVLGLALWLRNDSAPSAIPLGAPEAEAPKAQSLDSAQPESAPETGRAEVDTPPTSTKPTQLVVLCVARSNQHPLAGVQVRVTNAERLVTDGNGRAVFDVPPGRTLSVSADDIEHLVSFEMAEVPALAAGETRELKLEHESGAHARFWGVVVARDGGQPVAGAEVRVENELRTSTDSVGRFEIDYASFRAPAIRVDARGWGPALVGAGPGHESPERARRVELDRAAALVVALQVPEGQSAARVVLRANAWELSQDQAFTTGTFDAKPLKWEAQADAQWVCTFEELPPGISLAAEVLGSTGVLFHAADPIVLKAGERKRLEWDLRGCELVGTVFETDGKPAPGIQLWLLHAQEGYRPYIDSYQANELVGRATSAADGRFRFVSVSPGTWVLAPKPVDLKLGSTPEDAIAPVPLEVTIRSGEMRSQVDVHLARGLYIRGTLLAPDGTAGVDGHVFGRAQSGESVGVETDAQGVFALGPLAPGTFSLEGSANDTYLSSLPVAADAGSRDVVLLLRPGSEVSGQVVDGQSGAGVLAAITVGGENGTMTMTRTQPDGRFRFVGLAAGRHTIFATTTGGQAGELAGVVLDPGAPVTGLQVVLKPGATLRIRYEGTGVGQASVRRGSAMIGGDGVEAGRSITATVPPGRIAVVFRYPGVEQPETQELVIGAGEERELVFKAPPK